MSVKNDFMDEAVKITSEGIGDLLSWLDKTDFFTAPASTKFHGAEEGGLVLHSMSVLDTLFSMNEFFQLGISENSLRVCGLFHDLCKVDFYEVNDEPASNAQINYMLDLCKEKHVDPPSKRERTKDHISRVISALKDGVKTEMPNFIPSYRVKDILPMGHGEKSVYLIQKHMKLIDEEALAIRWHLAGFDPGIHFSFPNGMPCLQSFKEHKLVALLASADLAVTYLADSWLG